MIRVELRYAIWLAYGKKDAYGRGLIEDFNDLEIDHIIPKSIDEIILRQKIAKYELGEAFTIDSIENLIPTSKAYNRLKAEIVFDESHERYFLGIAKGKKQKVEEELTKVIKNLKLKEKVQFKEFYKITDTEQFGLKPTYFNSNTLIALNGYLPSKFEGIGSCAIEFYEMGSMISLNHEVLSGLINGKKDFTLEEQVLNYYNDKNERAFIIIGTSSLHLKKEAYDQFLGILNDFLIVYDRYIKNFEEFFELQDFEVLDSKEHYKLAEIDQSEWDLLIAYSYKHDLDHQSSTDFYFTPNPNALILIDKDESILKFTVTRYLRFKGQSHKVVLLWHLPKIGDRKFITNGKVLTAKKTLHWIYNIINDIKDEEKRNENSQAKVKKNYFMPLIKKMKSILGRG
jgi:hypothetical protein